MYTVSIYNQRSNQWRSTTEATLSACVQLTMGLATEWIVSQPSVGMTASDIVKGTGRNVYPKNTERYKHAVRSLVCRWVNRYAKSGPIKSKEQLDDYRFILRLCDSTFYRTIKIATEHARVFPDSPYALFL